MTIIRSLAFNTAFYLNLIIQMIIFTPYYFLSPRKQAWSVPKNWAKSNLWLQKLIVGTDHHIDGLENIPDGPYICAAKHQSFWDTYAFLPHIADPVYILKRELTWIPLFGWYIQKMKMVPIDRGKRSAAMKTAVNGARQAVAAEQAADDLSRRHAHGSGSPAPLQIWRRPYLRGTRHSCRPDRA